MNVVDFFCGCGGTSLGFQHAGMNVAVGIDIDPMAGATFMANFPRARFSKVDIRDLGTEDLAKLLPPRPWLFSGCAPCQPFSKQNSARRARDSRRTLLDHFGRHVSALRPEYVFVENVPGLQRIGHGGPFGRFQRTLKDGGYHSESGVLPALWFGVPQLRERLVVLASRLGPISLPEPTHGHGRLPFTTVRQWIGSLPPLEAGQTDPHDSVHRASALSAPNIRRIQTTPEGSGRESWPDELLLMCHRGHKGHGDVYGRLAWGKPAAGITTRCISLSNGRFGHPAQDRALSAREAACLQTFPLNYKFLGTLTSMAVQIGNAVPPLMARCVGETFMAHYRTISRQQDEPRRGPRGSSSRDRGR